MQDQCNPTAFYQSEVSLKAVGIKASLKPVDCEFNFDMNEPLYIVKSSFPRIGIYGIYGKYGKSYVDFSTCRQAIKYFTINVKSPCHKTLEYLSPEII